MSTETINVDLEGYRLLAGLSWTKLAAATGIDRNRLQRNFAFPGEFKVSEFARLKKVLKVPDSAVEAVG